MFAPGARDWTLQQPVRNSQGNTLLGFVFPSGFDPRNHSPVTAALVALRCDGDYLVGYNRMRRRWELPAGGVEWGETHESAALRELQEEACQSLLGLRACGYARARRTTGMEKYTAMFFAEVPALQPFTPNNEWSRIELWNLRSRARDFDPLDRMVLEVCDRLMREGESSAQDG